MLNNSGQRQIENQQTESKNNLLPCMPLSYHRRRPTQYYNRSRDRAVMPNGANSMTLSDH